MTTDQYNDLLIYELSLYMKGDGYFANGAILWRKHPLVDVETSFERDFDDEKMSSMGWWNAYDSCSKYQKDINETSINVTINLPDRAKLFCSWHNPYPKSRNQLGQERVEKLLFMVINYRVLNNEQIDDDFVNSVLCRDDKSYLSD